MIATSLLTTLLENDRLSFAASVDGDPKDFVPGKGKMVEVWERVKPKKDADGKDSPK
jgi:hypothetical protein